MVPAEEIKMNISASSSQDSSQEVSSAPEQSGDLTSNETSPQQTDQISEKASGAPTVQGNKKIGKSPGEIAFFKLLHAEFNKVTHFFDRNIEEFTIREERVREGMTIMKQPNSIMVNEKWSLMAKSIFALYKDLLLLETFAIMSYCSFSKILKKHDKVTRYTTREAFMKNIVNKANFTHYPKLLEMISRCERMYEEVSTNLLREGKESLLEDERLFINMIGRLNEQVLTSEDSDFETDRARFPKKTSAAATSTLRSIIEDNETATPVKGKASVAHVEGDTSDDADSASLANKRSASEIPLTNASKRPKVS